MATITVGGPFTLVNDAVYTVPARAFYTYAPAGDKLQFSNDGSNWVAAAGSAIPYHGIIACAYLRSHGADQIITLKGI